MIVSHMERSLYDLVIVHRSRGLGILMVQLVVAAALLKIRLNVESTAAAGQTFSGQQGDFWSGS